VRKHQKVFQSQHRGPGLPEYHRMAELVRNGRIGKLQRIEVILPKQPDGPATHPQPVPKVLDYEMWLGPAPFAPTTGTGCISTSDGSAIIRADHLRLGRPPVRHRSMGQRHERSGPVEIDGKGTFCRAAFTTRSRIMTSRTATRTGGDDCKPGNPSIKFIGTEGWWGTTAGAPRWRPVRRRSWNPRSARGNPPLHEPALEHDDFLKCVKSRKDRISRRYRPPREQRLHLANISLLLGRKLRWDPALSSS